MRVCEPCHISYKCNVLVEDTCKDGLRIQNNIKTKLHDSMGTECLASLNTNINFRSSNVGVQV